MRQNPGAFISPAAAAAAKKAGDKAQVRTPKEVLEAFSAIPITLGGLTVKPLNLATLMLLERLGNALAEESLTPESEISLSDSMEACYVLTHDEVECAKLLAEGRPTFDNAVLAFAATVPHAEIVSVVTVLARTFATAFASLVGGQKKTETTSSAPPPATASAGG